MKLKNLKARKILKAFQKMGFKIMRQTGTHVIMQGSIDGNKKTFPIPLHHKEVPSGTLTEILTQAGITREKFLEYY